MLKNLTTGTELASQVPENWEQVQVELREQLKLPERPLLERKEKETKPIELPPQKRFNFRLWSYLEKTHGNAGIHCSMIVDSCVWAGCLDGTIAIWHIRTGQLIGSRQAHKARIFAMTRVDENVWTASDDNKIRIWTPYACFIREILLEFRLNSMVNCGSTMWCGSFDQKLIAVIDTQTFQIKQILKLDIPVRYLFRDEDQIWICSETDILLANCLTYELGETIPGVRINSLLRVKDNIWAASSDSSISIYQRETKNVIHTIQGNHEKHIFCLMVFGNYVWSAGWDKFICIWDSENFSLVGSLSGHKEPINSIVVVPMTLPVKAISRPQYPANPLEITPKTLSKEPVKSSFSSMFGLLGSSTPTTPQQTIPSMPSRPASPAPAIETMDVPVECTIYSVWSCSWDGAVIMWL